MKVNKELVKGSTVILILTLLSEKAMYGYEMSKAIEAKSNGVFAFKEGTLYPILHSLEAEGAIEAYWSEADSGRKRKYYQITKKGTSLLKEKKEEWIMFRRAMTQVLGEGSV
ncbi:helix-turn-helix transcriptional regulator [Aneurinibacillus sp. BA2021]|nr:helix-turn-helix transcriptional regulator [Aneurinibacillus sp. BA2021]